MVIGPTSRKSRTNGRGMNITVKAGQKIQGISLTMTPGGTILGRVADANGDPLSRALIQAQKLIYQERGRSLVTVQAVYTDDRGDYRLFWLPAGQYYISATPSDERMRTMTAMVASPMVRRRAVADFQHGAQRCSRYGHRPITEFHPD